jgi:hypothetical protein
MTRKTKPRGKYDHDMYDGHPYANNDKGNPPAPKLRDKDGRVMPSNPKHDRQVRTFQNSIDINHLKLFITADERFEFLLRDLNDPSKLRTPLAKLMAKYNISLGELQVVYMDGMRQIAMLTAANSSHEIMADVVEDARSVYVVCARCDGDKVVYATPKEGGTEQFEKPCPTCDGVGKVRKKGDDHSRDIVFESMKITGQKGPLVAIQNNVGVNGAGLDAKMEGLLKRAQAVVVGGGKKEEEKNDTGGES